MSVKTFADTNIHVYAHSGSANPSDQKKKETALRYLDDCLLVVSTQVLREFTSVMLGKGKRTADETELLVEDIIEISEIIVDEDLSLVRKAFKVHRKYGYSYYDSLIISSALVADCKLLLSEDMQNEQIIEGTLKIVNPFR